MTLRQNIAEGGANGVDVTPANSGGGSGTPFDVVNVGVNSSMKYSAATFANGARSFALAGAPTEVSYLAWTGFSNPVLAQRMYLFIPEAPSVATQLMHVRSLSGNAARVIINTSRKISLQDATGTSAWTSLNEIPVNTWVRIDVVYGVGTTTSNGTALVAWAVGDGDPQAGDSVSLSGLNLGTAPLVEARAGKPASSNWGATFYVDNVAMDDGRATFIGPHVDFPTPPAVSAGPDLTREISSGAFTVTGTAAATTAGRTISSRVWQQVSGPAVQLSNTTQDVVTVVAPASAGTVVLRYTATDSGGLSSSDTAAISFVTPGQSLRPNGDVSTGGWTATPSAASLAANIDEAVLDTADYISSPDSPAGATYLGSLAPGIDPGVDTGFVYQLVAWVDAAVTSHSLEVTLLQGSTVIATRTFTDLTTTPQTREIQLTTGEAGLITDFSQLRHRLVATAS